MRTPSPLSTNATGARPSALATAVAAACLLVASPSFAYESGSTGADGAFNPAVSTEVQLPPSGILNYTSINIPAGVTVTFKKNALNTPVYLLVSGNVTIAGKIDVSGTDGKATGTFGDGNLADDGIPGVGGPGGFDGGRGGRDDVSQRPEFIRGGAGLGPGGGVGGIEGGDGSICNLGRYYPGYGTGGAYATQGSNYYFDYYCAAQYQPFTVAAKPYGSVALQPLIGGSGGGGGRGGANYPGAGGGGGGGAILIAANGSISMASSAAIYAIGGASAGFAGTGSGTWGGGGSGGAIRLIATSVSGSGALNADGGCATNTTNNRQYCGVATGGLGGSQGRIRIEANNITYSGSSVPTYVADTPTPVFVSNVPTLRITSIGGSNVPANPTGNADVTFPADLVNPVTVNFETTNVPTGNTVQLRVVPAYGNVINVLSPAITGSTASGTTSVSVSLPQGPSTLQAITSYTVTVAMGESLSRFAKNERVEKVEIIAGLKKNENSVRLITVSGKSYEVPGSVLQMAGFAA